jgi:tRNA threonylcarbamoyladenosine biosynthesis protein TsaE
MMARFGALIAKHIVPGDVIALVGDLGAGKTTLTQGLVEALGGQANSPTFSLVNEYEMTPLTIWHVDLYRIDAAHELPVLGLEDIFGNPRGVCLVEWADKFDCLPADHVQLSLQHESSHRRISISGSGLRGATLATALVNECGRLLE